LVAFAVGATASHTAGRRRSNLGSARLLGPQARCAGGPHSIVRSAIGGTAYSQSVTRHQTNTACGSPHFAFSSLLRVLTTTGQHQGVGLFLGKGITEVYINSCHFSAVHNSVCYRMFSTSCSQHA